MHVVVWLQGIALSTAAPWQRGRSIASALQVPMRIGGAETLLSSHSHWRAKLSITVAGASQAPSVGYAPLPGVCIDPKGVFWYISSKAVGSFDQSKCVLGVQDTLLV